ncbi:Type II secretory pathway pseudopilin [Streptococcus constellatus]|uniref:Type II secretory pathway pseudopilin n=1 Tax=Streptococcus constellatus TaxID=76860 RepID=A0A564TJV4_STRCV|nr:competence type IV pilus minor pilin ComGE [Streptococcus constellatus]VUW97203.1 Type II secretory pathway pseudopilin [Streptococcus gordonii]VUX07509.1 Type II secretory pathway pseudopilin [Streptococcus constellatus]
MGNLRKQHVRGTILLEALLVLGVFATIVTLLLGQIHQSRKVENDLLREEEVLRVANMALQTKQSYLTMNSIEVRVEKSQQGIQIYHGKELILGVQGK